MFRILLSPPFDQEQEQNRNYYCDKTSCIVMFSLGTDQFPGLSSDNSILKRSSSFESTAS